MSETETEIGWRIARGELPSPQRLPGFALFAVRFSGTGTAWREAHNEHVVRPPAEYLSPEMRARIAGVPVVTLHPENGNLDTITYAQTVIGAICFGYVANSDGILSDAGDELWCIARIGDSAAADAMATGQFSTSPAVIFDADSANETIKLQDGTSILFEGRPAVIDHLAACIDAGVWDKGAPPTGIRTDSTKEKTTMPPMAEDQPAQDIPDKRQDDHPGIEPDKYLTLLDTISKRLDAIEKGGHRTNDDPERAEWMREDSAGCLRDDAEEARETERLEREEGKPKEVAADVARKARRDRVKARKDLARHDSAVLTTAQAAAAREMASANLDVQARCDSVAQAWGERAPPPMQGETTTAYRVRLARHHQKHCTEPSFKTLDLGALAAVQPAALDGIERRIYADSLAASASPITEDDHLVPRVTVDQDSGHRITTFRGRHTFIWHLKRPSLRATAFMTPTNRN
jgi:hypothetical protein